MAHRGFWIGTVAAVGAALVSSLAFLAAGTGPAEAAFPGENGRIVYAGQRLMCDPRYCWDDLDYDVEIFAVNPDGSGQTNLTNSPDTNDGSPAVSPDGSKIAFIRNGEELWTMNADGSDPRRLTSGGTHESTATWKPDSDPTWSPDGTQIAFVRRDERFAAHYEVFVIGVDGSGQRRLTRNSLPEHDVDWSPDGTKMAVLAPPEDDVHQSNEIYTMNADGSGLRMLTDEEDPGYSASPEWSLDGTKIAYYGEWLFDDGWHSGTILMDADGSDKRYLFPYGGVVFSPDGEKVAFGGYDGIYVGDADGGGEPTRITDAHEGGYTNDEEWDGSPDWQPVCPCPPVPEPRDDTAPAVTSPRPSPGSEIRDRTPTVRAVVRDETSDLTKADVTLRVDGRAKGFSYDPDADRLSRATNKLSYGRHTVEVAATDAAGNTATKKWSFKVVRR